MGETTLLEKMTDLCPSNRASRMMYWSTSAKDGTSDGLHRNHPANASILSNGNSYSLEGVKIKSLNKWLTGQIMMLLLFM